MLVVTNWSDLLIMNDSNNICELFHVLVFALNGNYFVCLLFLLLLLKTSTSAWGLSRLWGGGIPTSDIDHYAPRLWRLTLYFNLAITPQFFILTFLDCSFPPYCLSPPHPQLFIVEDILFQSLPISSPVRSAAHLGLYAPSKCQPQPLIPAPLSTCLCFPPFSVTVSSPRLLPLACTQVPVSPWGVCLLRVPPLSACICIID